jgi:hypothetical protein
MRYKIIVSIIFLMFLYSVNCKSQETINKIFKSSKDRITEIENLGWEVIHMDLDLLSENEKEETRIFLNTGRKYVIAACGDQDRIQTVQIELYEEDGRTSIQKGRDGIIPSGSSVINFIPDKDNNYLITIKADEFSSNTITNGRYYLIVASKVNAVEIK